MYLLTIKDGFATRHIGPYESTKSISKDLKRALSTCSDRAKWKIHELEIPFQLIQDKFDNHHGEPIHLKVS